MSKEDAMKWSKITNVVSLIILLMMPGISFSGDPAADRPTYFEGDYWTLVNKNNSKEIKHSFLREEEDKIVCSLNESDRTRDFYFTAKMKRLPVGYPDPIIDVPLTVGKKWDYQFQKEGGQQDKIRAQYKVEAYESVSVPAGTFHAFKITSISEGTSKKITMTQKDQYWYCPEVKYIIKRIDMKGNTWELQNYNIK